MQRLGSMTWILLLLILALSMFWIGYAGLGPDPSTTAGNTPKSQSSRWLASAHAQTPTPSEPNRATDSAIEDPGSPVTEDSNTITDPNVERASAAPDSLQELIDMSNPRVERQSRLGKKKNSSLEALNLKNVEARYVIEAIARWTGKTVIPTDKVLNERLTIVAPQRLTQIEAIEQIYGALRVKGYVAEETEKTIYIRPLTDARLGVVPTLAANQPLATIQNKEQIVQKFFHLDHYDPAQMMQFIQPLIGEFGHVSADQSSGQLLIIDTVANLMRIENVIGQFDVSDTETTETRVFALLHRPPQEIVVLLETLLNDGVTESSNKKGNLLALRQAAKATKNNKRKTTGHATAVTVGTQRSAMTLISEPRFNWIIAKAAPDLMEQITSWIERLDKPLPTVTADQSLEQIDNQNQVVQRFVRLSHYSPSRMAAIIQPLLSDTGFVSADESTGNLLIIDTVENLLRVERIIAQFDEPDTEHLVTEIFTLRHRDPVEIVALLESLLSAEESRRSSTSRYNRTTKTSTRSRSGRGPTSIVVGQTGRTLTLIPEPTQNWIIAKAAPEDVNEIADWIERLDTPLPTLTAEDALENLENRNQVVQKFVTLAHYSPSRMAELVRPLMSTDGYVGADDTTGNLLLIDTVDHLLRIEGIIAQFDVPDSATSETYVFEIHHRKPVEIVEMLLALLGDEGSQRLSNNARYNRSPRSTSRSRYSTTASSIVVGTSNRRALLIPEDEQKWIIAKASRADLDQIGKWIERLDKATPTVLAVDSLAEMEDPTQRVQRCIQLESYNPTQMAEIVLPLMNENGYISADDNTGHLLLIDTVENLLRIEDLIAQFDIPEADESTTRVFELVHTDPAEVTQMLRMLLGDVYGRSGQGTYRPIRTANQPRAQLYSSRLNRGGLRAGAANSVLVGATQMPIVLIPEPRRQWIIARAAGEDLELITEWIAKIDQPQETERDYETIAITYADIREVASRLTQALEHMPGTELQASVLVQPLEQARQIIIFGRADLRETLKKLIQEIDVPPGQFETRHFELAYADPEQIKRNVEALFGEQLQGGRTRFGYDGRSSGISSDMVKVVAHVTLKQVTVIAGPENMLKIAEQIPEWDVPLDVNEVEPRIIELYNSDPMQITTLLSSLFSEENQQNNSWYDYLFGFGNEDKKRIIGPLYGQLAFEVGDLKGQCLY
ncbi:secretin N-terminal domain-containing protein [Planctomycetota bacterium]